SPEETIATLIDITHQLYVNPEDRAQAGRLQEQGTLQGFEFEAYRKDGEKIWLTVNRRCVRNPNGEVLYFEGSIEDVTTRRHIEEENRKTRQQYESLVQSIDGVVWEFDVRSSNFSFVSNQCERLLGYTSEQWLSDPDFWKDHLHPDDCAWVLEFCRDAMARRADHEFDYRMIAADGRVVWFRDIVTMDYTNPDVPHLRGVMVDITDRKLSEDELRKSEERYRELVENAHDLIYEHDLNGNYTSANKAGERLTGYTLEEALKLNLAQTVAPEYLEKAKDMLRRKLAGETVTAYELVVIAKDGRRIPVEVNTRLVLKNGVPVGVQGIARDITERKRVEEIQARRAAHTSFRADISAALALSTAPLRTTLASCVTAMVEHLGAAFARIWTLNRDGETLELQASVGMYTDLDGPYSRIPIGSFKTGKIAQERAPHITNQVQNDPEVSEEWARQQGLVAFAGYPLLLDSRLLGVMVMFSREELPEDTLDALASVADLISQGIERKRAEEGLRESEERYRLLFESNPQAMWVYDLETLRFLAVNEAAVQHYGYSREDFLSMTVKDILPAEDIPALYESFSSSCEHVDAAGTWRHLKKDGSLIEVEITSHLLRFDERQAELILAHDITERRQAEASRMHLLQRLVTAQEEEQRRLSRELHDQTGQSLAALMLGLKSIEDSGQLREAARNRLSQLQELTNQLARDVHQLASNLRPSALDDLGLHTALSNYVEEWSDRTKIRADFHSNGLLKRRLPRQIETAVYRVVQEALTNVFKHANAKNVSVILKYRGNRMQAIVEDDGRGFDSELLASAVNGDRRLGLLGMQERVALVQGHLNIESRAGAGTTVIVHIPVSTEQAEAQTE
ncbi:MAG TPA: PAS domain S-box protein, partial [Pyrinomonadaceae bacterium]|nr:PAS domain S-box protein [Pyrinomonadaceae bacterium]